VSSSKRGAKWSELEADEGKLKEDREVEGEVERAGGAKEKYSL